MSGSLSDDLDDEFEGGIGNDVFNWGPTSTFSVLEDEGGFDTLNIGAASTDVTFSSISGSSAIQLSVSGKALTIKDYLHTSGLIEKFVFSDGVTWGLEDIRKAIPSLPPVTDDDDHSPGEHIRGGKHHDRLKGTDNDDLLDGGKGHDWLRGGNGYDELLGGDGHDWLYGDAGDDLLVGGKGRDILTGGNGQDTFRFSSKSDSGNGKSDRDVIADFVSGTDKIDLSRIDANVKAKGNSAFTTLLSAGQKFTSSGQLRYDAKTGILSGNIDKDTAAEFQIHLKNKPAFLTLSDFIL